MNLFFLVFPTALFILSYVLLIRPAELPKYLKIACIVIFLVISFKNTLIGLFGGDLLSPSIPGWIVLWGSTSQVALIIGIVLGGIKKFIEFLGKLLVKKYYKPLSVVWQQIIFYLIIVVSTTFAFTCFVNAYQDPIIKEYEILDSRIHLTADKAKEGYKIVQLSDTHICTSISLAQVKKMVELTNSVNPDLIVITGDLYDGSYEIIKEKIDYLKNLKARDGVYMVYGNHEYYSKIYEWEDVLKSVGIKVLVNDNVKLKMDPKLKSSNLILAGITDTQSYKHSKIDLDHFYEKPSQKKALDGANPEVLPVVLLAHRPSEFRESQRQKVILTLSGHTHGGMLPILNKIVSVANNGYVSGLYKARKHNSYLLVSDGTFLWGGFFARLGTTNEINVIKLKPSK